jgi:hypothetical protein
MRWDNFFSDLESQLELGLTSEEDNLQAEEERLRVSRLGIRDRIMAMVAVSDRGARYPLNLILKGSDGSDVVELIVSSIGRDWLAAELVGQGQQGRQCVVPLSAIAGIAVSRRQLRHSLEPPEIPRATGALADRLGLAFILRDLCRRRTGVELTLVGETLFGTIDRVGRDHLDLAVHESGKPRRNDEVRALRIVGLDVVLMIRL